MPRARLHHDVEERRDFGGRPVELDDQHGVGSREVRVDRGLSSADRERVHHLHRGGNDSRANHLGHGRPASVDRVERRQQRLHRFGAPQDSNGDARDDGERAFRSDDQAEQIRSRRIGELAAEVHELAVGQHRLDAEDVMDGEAVLQAVRAPRIFGDVAADGAHLLARGVGRVVVAERRDLTRDLEVGHARFDCHPLVRDVDAQDTIQARESDHEAAGHRQRPARESRAVSARHERHAFARAEPHDRLNLRGRGRQDDRRGRLAQVRQGVALVGEQLQRIVQHAFVAGDPPQLGEEGAVHVAAIIVRAIRPRGGASRPALHFPLDGCNRRA